MVSMEAATERTDVMTDFQFKAILRMVIGIVRNAEDKDEIIRRLQSILDGKDEENPEPK